MESQKICRLLILIFLILTLLFCFLYSKEENEETVISEEFVSEAVENLNSNGIVISRSILEREIPEMNIYCFDFDPSIKYDSFLADALISGVFGDSITTTEFDTPGGTSLGIYNADSDENEVGRLVFSGDASTFKLSLKGVGMSGGENPILNNNTEYLSDTIKNKVMLICDRLINKNRFSYRIAGSTYDDYLIVTVVQTIEGHDIRDMYINFIFENENLILASGKWITNSPRPEYHNTLTDGINILYNLDFDEVLEIHSERVVYSLRKAKNNSCFLLPGWEIEYTDINGKYKKVYFDAV